jgi:processive 1,2-diacylglycerol beta-glucosyltransferase
VAAKRVLVLSASAGAGHVRAAEALVKDFQNHPDVTNGGDVQHWDILKYTTAVFRTIYSKVYLDLINRAPWFLGMVYKGTDKPWKETAAQAFEKFNAGPFIKALQAYKPDLVVCTHFTPPNIISWLNAKHGRSGLGAAPKLRPAIVVTDFDLHAMWLTRSYSRYFVALEETRVYLEQMGIDSDKITVSGIPVDPVFRTEKDKKSTRRALGLDEDRFTILISAGGFGVGPVELLLTEVLQMKSPAQVVAIAGKSEELKTKLEKLARKSAAGGGSGGNVKIFPIGFTKQMDDYMAAADILLSKPGGLTTSEAMARGLPMCVVNPIPGQEERNSDHLLEAGVAIRCNNPPTLGWKLESLMRDPARLQSMRDKARAFGKPRAGEVIVNSLLG